MPSSLSSPPQFDEIEVSLFGPGYGESILLHLGDENWIIVDSCIRDGADEPAVIQYLHRIAVDPEKHVKLIVATHWHDDHIRGLSKTFDTCKAAKFVCSVAQNSEEFLALTSAAENRRVSDNVGSGLREFGNIIKVLKTRANHKAKSYESPIWATSSRLLWQSSPNSSVSSSAWSLSPSDEEVTLAKRAIGNLIPIPGQAEGRILPRGPNHFAVVMWIEIGEESILLGSDLEETGSPHSGWTVIVDSETKPSGKKASVIKVPHHGSRSADQPRVWEELLQDEPFAILTPFIRGKTILPSPSDRERILNRTTEAYSTSNLRKRRSRRGGVVRKELRESRRNLRRVNPPLGHIRLRKPLGDGVNGKWEAELFQSALPLGKLDS